MASFHILKIGPFLRTLSSCGSASSFNFILDINHDISIQPGDKILGYVEEPINEFRFVFSVASVTENSLVLIKDLEVSKGVSRLLDEIPELSSDALDEIAFPISEELFNDIINQIWPPSIHMRELPDSNNANPLQIIYYGAPGTGKSYKVKNEIPKGATQFRVTFYPDYYYSDFVGGLRPQNGDNGVEYKFEAGPFARAIKDSFLSSGPIYFIIEEINRGNAAAIFGDLFQLLDRVKGKSDYSITNHDLYQYLADNGVSGLVHDQVYLPGNLNILCTMNTADQNVFVLDTAFKRRFRMEYVPIDFKAYFIDSDCIEVKESCRGYLYNNSIFDGSSDIQSIMGSRMHQRVSNVISNPSRNWPTFAAYVNAKIDDINSIEQKISEDKKLGPFFVETDELNNRKAFADKVLYYLKQDVFKYEDNILSESYEELYDKYVNQGNDLFTIFETHIS